ncbi:glycosyltransferase family 2 protein [Pseudomonas sp. Leaf129]|uniref:glycosyltransferase family 2 protein n=1 Tax=Pseudomonas sp. Leaf129 TaxID=1736268 RepID=UPI0009EC30BE|nr:glycosyltransferase [Pseudomonas sp. Leaf129]
MSNLPLAIEKRFEGIIAGLYGDVLHGWVTDNECHDASVVIEILVDGVTVDFVLANQFQTENDSRIQFHGFTIKIPSDLLVKAKVIGAKVANYAYWLKGTIQLPSASSGSALHVSAQVWHSGGLQINGWASDPRDPNRQIEIQVMQGSKELARVPCDLNHPAITHRDTFARGFRLDLPWELADGTVHILDVLSDDGKTIPGSPITICCVPEGLEALIKEYAISKDESTLNLLSKMAREQSQRLPKSVGFGSYDKWFDIFQRDVRCTSLSENIKTGILLFTCGDEKSDARSIRSITAKPPLSAVIVQSAQTNILPALKKLLAEGCDSIVPIASGDYLAPQALNYLNEVLAYGYAWGYSDCDRDSVDGRREYPWFKPSWDINLFIGADVVTPGSIFSRDIILSALKLIDANANTDTENCDWHSVIAAIALATENASCRVFHLPQILYHRAYHSIESPEQGEFSESRCQAIRWLCASLASGSYVQELSSYPALLRVKWPLPNDLPKVSLIIPTRDKIELLRTCVEGIINITDYPNIEIIVIDNNSSEAEALDYLNSLSKRGISVLRYPFPFNYSAINNFAVRESSGQIIGLINNDIEILDKNWLKEMVSELLRPRVGIVGAKLLWPNNMVQHGGVVIGINNLAAHVGNTLNDCDAGYLATNLITRKQSAVTAACMLFQKSTYEDVAGFDEVNFPVAFNDIDLCLRVAEIGLNIVWTPFAKLTHAESASRGKDLTPEKRARSQREQHQFMQRWSHVLEDDPYYHPALSSDYVSGPYGGLKIQPAQIVPRCA